MRVSNAESLPINIVGSSSFGRYPKISVEKTYNMFISDEWLVSYPGFQKVIEIEESGVGRGFFHSARGNFNIFVTGSDVWRMDGLATFFVGTLASEQSEVSIDENLSSQICIVDGINAYIYNYSDNSFTQQSLAFNPGYVCYHNTFFLLASIVTDTNPQLWYAAEYASPSTITIASTNQFTLQTKPDSALAVKRLPGRGNNVIVFGSVVAEVWQQVGGLENYRRVSSFNIDMGVVSIHTIAASEQYVCWLAQNENNSPVIMVTDGSSFTRISSDGIDYLLQSLNFPAQSTAFFYRVDGHLFYQIAFFNPADNLSLVYDFNTQKFFHVTDENQNYHPARQIVYSNGNTYFCSLNDASIYQTGTDFVDYNYDIDNPNSPGDTIPRIRICKTLRREDSTPFRVGRISFWMEQGVNDYFIPPDGNCTGLMLTEEGDQIVTEGGEDIQIESGSCFPNNNRPCVDFNFSKNGGMTFSASVRNYLNPQGVYRNRITWNRMGMANEFTSQFYFWGVMRICANDGVVEIY